MKVHTGAETPSQQVVADANRTVEVTDARGRKLKLRQPQFADEFRIVAVVGAELAQNQVYMGMLNPLLFITEIDGVVQPFPSSKIAVDSLINTAGREGFVAAFSGIQEHFGGQLEGFEEQVKNGPGTPA
ncbi:hypothetical protein R5W24_000480 [Gemmata sp. JC717]|uniref:hypothetical protein n=1 Tax=Gemmata algarum TaxID=2975278 RepID=UPI0021BA7BE7|nr:hypothetical protein [Gemmata algarum]MDY3551404.1 hypothetical protein [Gemmata algarum]